KNPPEIYPFSTRHKSDHRSGRIPFPAPSRRRPARSSFIRPADVVFGAHRNGRAGFAPEGSGFKLRGPFCRLRLRRIRGSERFSRLEGPMPSISPVSAIRRRSGRLGRLLVATLLSFAGLAGRSGGQPPPCAPCPPPFGGLLPAP